MQTHAGSFRASSLLIAFFLALFSMDGCGDNGGPAAPATETPPVLTITTASLPDGGRGVAYSGTLLAEGGAGSHTWALVDGSENLPTGLSLGEGGGITGIPAVVETQGFTVAVASDDGQTASRAFSIAVIEPQILLPGDSCGGQAGFDIATFEDDSLEAAVRDALGLGDAEPLTCSLLAGLETLFAEERGIGSLVGSQNLTGMTVLDLNDLRGQGAVADLDPLGGLTSLTGLYIYGSRVTDLSPLDGLPNLESLGLGWNLIGDVSALGGLTQLTTLDVGGNSIADISPLGGLTQLLYLVVGPNPIGNAAPLANLTALWHLDARHGSIGDVSVLAGLTSLNYLYLDANAITDIGPLGGLVHLLSLTLNGNSISNLAPLAGLTELTGLSLGGNSISDISPLAALTSLAYVDLSRNSIVNISALSGLTELVRVSLAENSGLIDVQPLLDNPGFGEGDEFLIFGTGVDCADVAALEAKGVTVVSDCP